MKLPVMRLEGADAALPLPAYQTSGSAGADLRADLMGKPPVVLEPGQRALIQTGLAVAVPEGFELQVRPRSGLALKEGVTVANSPGTVDSDYRGPLGVILINLGDRPFTVEHGTRIAQAVVAPVQQVEWFATTDLSETDRGSGGFGSTGR